VWSYAAADAVGRPVVAGGVVYATVHDSDVAVLGASDGAVLDFSPPYQGVVGHVVVTGGRLYATDGRVLDVYAP
jgi:outer membrane protein assembly factor BamB